MASGRASASSRETRVRYFILAILFLTSTVSYADRASMGIAGSTVSKALALSPVAMGYILSAFAIAYVLGQIPGGALLDRFGSKRVYATALVSWSLFTFLQGLTGSFNVSGAAIALFLLRFMVGLCEAPGVPANARIVANWFPADERGIASSIFNAAQYFALFAFGPFMGWLVHAMGWPYVFFVMGGLGIAVAILFWFSVKSPLEHPWVNAAERDRIESGGALIHLEARRSTRSPLVWRNVKQLLTSRMLLGTYLSQYSINVLTYFFSTWFPIYLVQQRGLSVLQAGFSAAIPAICGLLGGILGGLSTDFILKKTGSVTTARRIPLLIGMSLATLIVGCNYVSSGSLVIFFMSCAFFGKAFGALGWAVVADTSPRELIGVAGGVSNMVGNLAGIVSPIVIGYIVAATGSFDWALIYVAAHCLLAIFSYFVIVQKIERLELKPL